MFVLALACTMPMAAQVQQIVGEWITVDDKTGEQLSVVKIFEGIGADVLSVLYFIVAEWLRSIDREEKRKHRKIIRSRLKK